jgi:DNA-binding transcriptional regulator YiaG
MTGTKYAKKFGHTKNQVSAWEQGRDQETIPSVVLHPKLTAGECLWIARRRRNFGIREMAEKMETSHVTYVGWEADSLSEKSQSRAINYWNKRGWPKKKRGE